MLSKILGERSFFFEEYLNQTLRLVASLSIVNENEANRYNEWLRLSYPDITVDEENKSSWRYYKHLAGEKHTADQDVKLTSLDTGEPIKITKANMVIHAETRDELLKYDVAYEQLIEKYPEQIHYINACIVQLDKTPGEIAELPNFTIVSYNDRLVEKREHNLIFDLQTWLYQYQVTWAMPYYNLTDVLYLAAQTVSLSQALVQKIFNLRLKNAKTNRAHSFHVISYLASHNRLDNQYRWLSEKQVNFLYRNILYLRNHIGQQQIFKTLIKFLFEERKISVSNYTFRQIDSKDDESHKIFYRFVRRFLTIEFGSEAINIYDLDKIKEIETLALDGNLDEWISERKQIESKLDNTLFDRLLTKDLESSIYDYTDNVRVPLAEVIINTWGYLLKKDLAGFNVTLTNYFTNKDLTLSSIDGFRLYFTALILRYHNFPSPEPVVDKGNEFISKIDFVDTNDFPIVKLKHLWKDPPPDLKQIADESNYTGPASDPDGGPLFYEPPRSDFTGREEDDYYIKPYRGYYHSEIKQADETYVTDIVLDLAQGNVNLDLEDGGNVIEYYFTRLISYLRRNLVSETLKENLLAQLGILLDQEIPDSDEHNHISSVIGHVQNAHDYYNPGSEIHRIVYQGKLLTKLRIPTYTNTPSISVFKNFAESIYHLEMKMWFYESNISDIDDNAIMERLIMKLHKVEDFDYNNLLHTGNNETISEFLLRVGFYDILDFSNEQLDKLIFDIINYVYDKKYEELFEVRFIQRAMVDIFNQLSSYSVQFVNTYTNNSPTLAHTKSLRFGDLDLSKHRYFSHVPIFYYKLWYAYTEESWPLNLRIQFRMSSVQNDHLAYEIPSPFNIYSFTKETSLLALSSYWKITETNEDQNQPTEEHVRFLIENLYS